MLSSICLEIHLGSLYQAEFVAMVFELCNTTKMLDLMKHSSEFTNTKLF